MSKLQIGVCFQPSFEYTGPQLNVREDRVNKWLARGVNLYLQGTTPEPNTPANTRADFARWLSDRGMRWMIGASADPAADAALPGWAGFTQLDEPDLLSHIPRAADGTYNVPAAVASYQAEYARIKKAVPTATVHGNFAGPMLTSARPVGIPNQPVDQTHYAGWCQGADIVSSDWYLTNTGRDVGGYLRGTIGAQVDRLLTLGKGKPVWAVIECSNQRVASNGREPTPDEFRAMVWMAIAHGATGIVYFPQQIAGGFRYDAMSDALAQTMTGTNAELQRLADYITGGTRTLAQDGTADVATFTGPAGKLVVRVDTAPPKVTVTETPADPLPGLVAKLAELEQRVGQADAQLTAAVQRIKQLEDAPKVTGVKLILDR